MNRVRYGSGQPRAAPLNSGSLQRLVEAVRDFSYYRRVRHYYTAEDVNIFAARVNQL